jgi:transcriptional regulator with XRE-family HTH domain
MSMSASTTAYAHRLREARRAKGILQIDLAELVGVTHQTISAAENGKHELSASKFVRWARACDVDLAWLAEDIK